VSRADKYCRNCGANLLESTEPLAPPTYPPQETMAPSYERRFSLVRRFYKLLVAPSEAMKDIALAPDYTGFFVIVVLEFLLAAIAVSMAMQKIQLVGTYGSRISSMLGALLVVAVVIALFLIIVRWVVKSLIVRHAGDSGSGWSFSTAASVTGYAYFADVVFTILGIAISWLIVPTFIIDTTNLDTAIQLMNDYRAQINSLKLAYSLPFNLVGLVWKSYLGGLGTHFGTNEECSIRAGFIVFFVLGLIRLLISFVTS